MHRYALTCAAVTLILAGSACSGSSPARGVVEIDIRYSKFSANVVEVPVGHPVQVQLRNTDPIDHEWIVGDDATHQRHATGTEPEHVGRPTEVSLPALSEQLTTVQFDIAGDYRFVCHLPGHEAYGMAGILRVR